jgi:integrin-linked kinase
MGDYSFSFCDKNRLYNPAWMSPEGFFYIFYVCINITFYSKSMYKKALSKKLDDYSKKPADMWSFAIILWELYTKEIPFEDYLPMQCGILVSIFYFLSLK